MKFSLESGIARVRTMSYGDIGDMIANYGDFESYCTLTHEEKGQLLENIGLAKQHYKAGEFDDNYSYSVVNNLERLSDDYQPRQILRVVQTSDKGNIKRSTAIKKYGLGHIRLRELFADTNMGGKFYQQRN